MACYHPLSAFDTGLKTVNGKTKYIIRPEGTQRASFGGRWLYDVKFIPCGKCIGCRLDYASTWSKRIMLEKTLYPDDECHFITLTYDDDKCPPFLIKKHAQDFMKRLRKHYSNQKIRFFLCGEYGSNTFRPHFHAIIFGLKIDDLKPIHKLDKNSLKTSDTIRDIWNYGHIAIGETTLKSAGYVAQYVIKKRTYTPDEKPLDCIQQPFTLMSRRPGIGANAFKLEWFNNNEIILEGTTFKPGKFYNNLFDKLGYNRDCFNAFNDMRMNKNFNDYEDYFEHLHDVEFSKIQETKILKERERRNA